MCSELVGMQKYEEIWIKQNKLEWEAKLKLIPNEFKYRSDHEKCESIVCLEEEPNNSKKEQT